VCDQPHPLKLKAVISKYVTYSSSHLSFLRLLCIPSLVVNSWRFCHYGSRSAAEGRAKEALDGIMSLWQAGYAATDIIQTLFRVSVIRPDLW
jgi:hypothetical protein